MAAKTTETDFSKIQQFMESINKSVVEKTKELDTKEKEILAREEKVEKVLGRLSKCKNKVTLRVGDQLFYTTSDVLRSVKDSYFCALLNPDFGEPEEGIYSIPREAEVFKYVLEFMIYGQLISELEDRNVLKKLVVDAEYYLLPQLKEQAEKQLKQHAEKQLREQSAKPNPVGGAGVGAIYAKFVNGIHGGTGQYWQWHSTQACNPTFFTLSTQHYANDTITVLAQGTYLVMVRTACRDSGNGNYMALYVNGADVARTYSGINTNYSTSQQVNEVLMLKSGDKIQVYHTYSSGPINSNPHNQFSIVYLGP